MEPLPLPELKDWEVDDVMTCDESLDWNSLWIPVLFFFFVNLTALWFPFTRLSAYDDRPLHVVRHENYSVDIEIARIARLAQEMTLFIQFRNLYGRSDVRIRGQIDVRAPLSDAAYSGPIPEQLLAVDGTGVTNEVAAFHTNIANFTSLSVLFAIEHGDVRNPGVLRMRWRITDPRFVYFSVAVRIPSALVVGALLFCRVSVLQSTRAIAKFDEMLTCILTALSLLFVNPMYEIWRANGSEICRLIPAVGRDLFLLTSCSSLS
jgi:hypothetical protein